VAVDADAGGGVFFVRTGRGGLAEVGRPGFRAGRWAGSAGGAGDLAMMILDDGNGERAVAPFRAGR